MDSIYKINKEVLDLKRLLEDDEIDEQMYLDTLDCYKMSVEQKAECIAYVNKEIKSTIEQIKMQKEFLSAKEKMLDTRIKKINEHMMQLMINAEVEKCTSGIFTISIANNGGKQALEVDEENVPDEYMKVIYQIDNDKIRADLDAGKELSFARLLPRGKSLRIK